VDCDAEWGEISYLFEKGDLSSVADMAALEMFCSVSCALVSSSSTIDVLALYTLVADPRCVRLRISGGSGLTGGVSRRDERG
jgi:hypothetical protein